MDAAPVSLPAYYRLLRDNTNYRKLWFAQIISEVGDWFYTVALYSLLFDLTSSAKSVAAALVFQVLPQFFFGPTAGVINDHASRRKVMIFSDVARAGIVILMVFVRTKEMLPFLYLLLLMETLMWALFEPGRSAVIPNITSSPGETVTANGLGSTTWAFNFFFGSALGGAAAVLLGRDAVFIINSLSFLLSAWLVRSMSFHEPHTENKAPLKLKDLFDFKPITEGLRYVRSHPGLRPVILLKAGVRLMGANWVILPTLGERVFPLYIGNVDAQRAGMLGMSMLLGARGLGALIGPLSGGAWAGKNIGRMKIGVAIGFALVFMGYTSLGYTTTIFSAIPAVVLAHAGGSMVWVFSSSMLHFMSNDEFRGRVFSADYMFMTLMLSISSWSAGVLVDGGITVQRVATFTGLVALLPLTLWFAFGLRRERSS